MECWIDDFLKGFTEEISKPVKTSGKEYEYPYEVVFNTYVDGLMAVFNQAFWSKKDYTLEQLRNYMHEIYYN